MTVLLLNPNITHLYQIHLYIFHIHIFYIYGDLFKTLFILYWGVAN